MPYKAAAVKKKYKKEYNKKYYQENKDYFKEYNKEYHKKYYQENKDYFKEYHKKYYQENKDYFKEHSKKYWQENKEFFGEYKRKNPWVEMTKSAQYRNTKKKTNLPFNITSEYVKSIWPSDNKCPALGIKLKRGTEGSCVDSSPSLDRIDNSKGYIEGNVQIVCHLANKIMSNATPDQVIQVGEYFKRVTEELGNDSEKTI